jgi:hypothetical protein
MVPIFFGMLCGNLLVDPSLNAPQERKPIELWLLEDHGHVDCYLQVLPAEACCLHMLQPSCLQLPQPLQPAKSRHCSGVDHRQL